MNRCTAGDWRKQPRHEASVEVMRILITGADGQLGHELRQVLAGHTVLPFTRPAFDLLSPHAERQILEARPDMVIHAAAYANVDLAEQEPDLAMAVNATGTQRVARAAAACAARLIYISTDYVFDGRKTSPYEESDQPNPLSAYGRSKLEGERLALATCPRTLVLRTAWLYGSNGRNFVTTIAQLAAERPELRVVADQRGCPTYAKDLARALTSLLTKDLQGILHVTGGGDCTWHELACAIVAHSGLTTPVLPITTAEVNRAALRPVYSVLSHRMLDDLGIGLPHWTDGLVRCLKAIRTPADRRTIRQTA